MQIPVVDIFAGPGGLGEGLSAFLPRPTARQSPFRIAISAEMESNAAKTLRLRAFFRQFAPGHAPASYYEYVAGRTTQPWTEATKAEWLASGEEARQLKLGVSEDDEILSARIHSITKLDQPWVLIGGPPCQAYSLVGRARNRGIAGYRPEDDERYVLYKHYLKLVNKFRPAVFVMENVKGLLSAKVDEKFVFREIVEGLERPGGRNGPRYRLVPLVVPKGGLDSAHLDPRSYVLRAETLGVPQARHRVILLGISEELFAGRGTFLVPDERRISVTDVIGGLPRLRSGVTDCEVGTWWLFAQDVLESAGRASKDFEVAAKLEKLASSVRKRDPGLGGRWTPGPVEDDSVPAHLRSWLLDPRLEGILNHEVREHMASDLKRYAFASAFAQVHGRSPRGSKEFPAALHPKHKNWKSGKFVDRFKVQLADSPSSTVTSHLSKDGHYFIHPDPSQLRSLSVREAARLQTFPDNYFFEGPRGAQFKQVGNAVPPWMAQQIAGVVYSYLRA
ncbi:MAG: DNA (cytosine-5-)-methyltransferase [Lysobacteraceae bacterium]